MTRVYYNENDRHAAAWLRRLMVAGRIPAGVAPDDGAGLVDERSILDVRPTELAKVRQAHFFAGIGGWPLALQLAGWGDRTIWTGSCPCQPFSSAGQRRGAKDPRHLWPAWFRLIRECRPDVIFGEQVASAIGHGWLDGISADLEGAGYTVGAAVLGAHSVGAPHIRQRLFWVADRTGRGRTWSHRAEAEARHPAGSGEPGKLPAGPEDARSRLADGDRERRAGRHAPVQPRESRQADAEAPGRGADGRLGQPGASGLPASEREAVLGTRGRQEGRAAAESGRTPRGLVDAGRARGRRNAGAVPGAEAGGHPGRQEARREPHQSVATGVWDDYVLVPCADGKARRTQPGLQCLVDGVPFRLADGRTREGASRPQILRGIGNAIVAPVAAEFVTAFLEAEGATR